MANVINNSDLSNDSLVKSASANENGMISVFNYSGNNVTFKTKEGIVYVNATQMAKSFGKRPSKWLELPSTKEYMSVLTDVRKLDIALIETDRGGIEGGGATWVHEDVALEFARWLSPEFAIWCNDRIKELLSAGKTEIRYTEPKPTMTSEERELRLKEVNFKMAEMMLQIGSRTNIPEFKQIIDSYAFNTMAEKNVLPLPEVNEKTYSTTEIGNILGVSANRIGKLANQYGLKTAEYGKLFYDKSKYSNKEVETFRYYKKKR